jgi:hypothetical protein
MVGGMPSLLHEALVAMFRDRPSLATDVLAHSLGIRTPRSGTARVSASELTTVTPTEYRADLVITVGGRKKTALAVVMEAQLSIDMSKRRSWPVYLATLHARFGCEVALLVVCPNKAVANWCAKRIVLGPSLEMTPLVLGPQTIPILTDPELAQRNPELAVLSALAHGAGGEHAKVLNALSAALLNVDKEHAKLYVDVVLANLPTDARHYLEDIMTSTSYQYQSDFARRYFDEGEARGEARAVLTVLDARGIDVPDEVRTRVTSCTDVEQLNAWVRRAATVTSAQDLFT